MPDLSWLPRATLMGISIVLTAVAARVFVNRVHSRVWSQYDALERRALQRATWTRNSDTLVRVARTEHRAAFERLRESVLFARRAALGCMVASLLAFMLSMLSRYLA